MFDIAPTELLIVALVALVVIGPKDLPRVMRTVGHWVGKARGMARHFRSGIDTMIREAELEEMEKKWRAENERIMREYPQESAEALPAPDDAAPAAELQSHYSQESAEALPAPDEAAPPAELQPHPLPPAAGEDRRELP